jgi:hypothetical protein
MTRRDILECAHEPFGDAFYYGPERLSNRYDDEVSRIKSGFSKTTYKDVLNRLEKDGNHVSRPQHYALLSIVTRPRFAYDLQRTRCLRLVHEFGTRILQEILIQKYFCLFVQIKCSIVAGKARLHQGYGILHNGT